MYYAKTNSSNYTLKKHMLPLSAVAAQFFNSSAKIAEQTTDIEPRFG